MKAIKSQSCLKLFNLCFLLLSCEFGFSQNLFLSCYEYCSGWPGSATTIGIDYSSLDNRYYLIKSNSKIIKFDDSGNLIWSKQYPYYRNYSISNINDTVITIHRNPFDLKCISNQQFCVFSTYDSLIEVSNNGNSIYSHKKYGYSLSVFDSAGALIWSKNVIDDINYYTSHRLDFNLALNSFIICSRKFDTSFVYGTGNHVALTRIDANGSVLFTKKLQQLNAGLLKIVSDNKGNTYLLSGDTNYTPLIIKFDSTLNVVWATSISDSTNFYIYDITVNESGESLISWSRKNTLFKFAVSKIDSSGILQWAKSFGFDQFDDKFIGVYNGNGYFDLFFKSFRPSYVFGGFKRDTTYSIMLRMDYNSNLLSSTLFSRNVKVIDLLNNSSNYESVNLSKRTDNQYLAIKTFSSNSMLYNVYHNEYFNMDTNLNICNGTKVPIQIVDSVINLSSISKVYNTINTSWEFQNDGFELDTIAVQWSTKCLAFADVNEIASPDNSILIYPNPASDYVVLKLNSKSRKNYMVKIYNATGVLVFNREMLQSENEIVIPVNEFSDGLYLISVEGEKRLVSRMMILK